MQIFSVIFTLWPNFCVLTRNDGARHEERWMRRGVDQKI